MKRDYVNGNKDNVTFFYGTEVEHTPAYGMKTLFVVGVEHINTIDNLAKNQGCQHIYLGANQSFDLDRAVRESQYQLYDVVTPWDKMATELLEKGYLVTLDFDVKYAETVLEMTCSSHNNFIPQISVKIPYTTLFNYNAMVKIDDKDFNCSNPGVWCHSLHSLLDRKVFTDWNQYKKDHPL